jgi:hypothetical protein
MNDEPEVQSPTPGSLLTMIADVSEQQDRRYKSITERLTQLEAGKKSADDPEKMLMTFLVTMLILQVGLPLLGALIQKWVSPSS